MKLVNHLQLHKNDFSSKLSAMVADKKRKIAILEATLKEITSYEPAVSTTSLQKKKKKAF